MIRPAQGEECWWCQEIKVPFWVPLCEITSLHSGVYSIPLPAPFFHSTLLKGLPMCTFFFRCLILTQKIAGFNSFARWLRKEQLTVSAKCLCQNPKQPIPINIKSRTELLKCKCKMMGWKKNTKKKKDGMMKPHPGWEKKTHSILYPLRCWPHCWVERRMYSRMRGECRSVPLEQPPWFLSV